MRLSPTAATEVAARLLGPPPLALQEAAPRRPCDRAATTSVLYYFMLKRGKPEGRRANNPSPG